MRTTTTARTNTETVDIAAKSLVFGRLARAGLKGLV